MGDQWYCMVVGQEVGPITSDDLLEMLEQGQIDADDTVRNGPTGDWQPVRQALDVSSVAVAAPENPSSAAHDRPRNGPPPTWYCRMLGSEFGPFTIEEIQAQAAQEQLAPDDEVREGRHGPWKAASTLPGLFTESAVRQRQIEIEQTQREREQKKRERRLARGAKKILTKKRSDDILDGLDDLEDVPMPAAPAGLAAFSAKSLPADPAARAEMLKKLDAEYQRLRSQLAVPAESPTSSAASTATPAAASHPAAATNPRHDPAMSSNRVATSEPSDAAFDRPSHASSFNNSPATPAAPPPPPEPSRPASLMQDMAAAQIRAAQSSSRPTPRAPYAPSSRSSGGGGFDFSNLNISGRTMGIAAAIVGVLVIGYFGRGLGLIDFSSGAVYDETVKLYGEFKQVAEKDPASAEFTAFQQNFKKKQQEMLGQLGQPKRGSTADEVRRAVLALGTVIEAYRRPEITKAEREPFVQALDTQMTKLKQNFGR